MFHTLFPLALLCLGLTVTATPALAAPVCSQVYRAKPVENLDFKADVFLNGKKVGDSLYEAYSHPDVKKAFTEAGIFTDKRTLTENHKLNKSKLLLEARLPQDQGGGVLRLVTLNLSREGFIYNHPELLSLLTVNPSLANAMGLYRVPFSESLAWAPDATVLNARLARFSQQNGFKRSSFYFETIEGLAPPELFLQQIARGVWPASGPSRPEMVIHDSLHSIAFAAMSSRPNARKILSIVKTRAAAAMIIAQKLKADFGEGLFNKFLEDHASGIVTGPAERSMLFVILSAGQYDYQSSYQAWRAGNIGQKLNRELTQKRLEELLAQYSFGTVTFKEALQELSKNLRREQVAVLTDTFQKAKRYVLVPTEKEIEDAASELMDFFPSEMFSDAVPSTGETRASRFYLPSKNRDDEG